MPLFLIVDFTALAFSLMVSTALLIIVSGSGLRKPLNHTFALFALLQAGWAGASLLLRLSLWFHLGKATPLLYVATGCFAFMAPSSFSSWPVSPLCVFLAALDGSRRERRVRCPRGAPPAGKPRVRPLHGRRGATLYELSAWGYAVASSPACASWCPWCSSWSADGISCGCS